MGIGGGFIATIYEKSTKDMKTLIARETAPLSVNEESTYRRSFTHSRAMSIGVPGELLGYWELHKNYGKLPWEKLVQPAINLCRDGHLVTDHLENVIGYRRNHISRTPSLNEVFINPDTGRGWKKNDIIYEPILGGTLETIAREGITSFYGGGTIGRRLVEDIQNYGGIITDEDLYQYKIRWTYPEHVHLNGQYDLYTCPLPGGGPILCFIMNLIRDFIPYNNSGIMWHRLIESFKHGYGLRTQLGDVEFEPQVRKLANNLIRTDFAESIRQKISDTNTYVQYEFYGANRSSFQDEGTANVAVLSPNGDAITLTSTINDYFGCGLRSRRTGIVFNDAMDDFSTTGNLDSFGTLPSCGNFVKPQKMPLSSMSPTIVLDSDGDVRLLIGAAGGSKIITTIATTIIRHLFLNESLQHAMSSPRIHHQLTEMNVECEGAFDSKVIKFLKSRGHNVEIASHPIAALTAIAVDDGNVIPIYDPRRGGSSSVVF